MKIGKVYMITCIITGKIYIGSTAQEIYDRWKRYYSLDCKSQIKLYRSLRKYGTENHIFEIIWEGELETMLEKETILGNFYEVLDKQTGLNLRLPKLGEVYQFLSAEARENFRNGQLGRKHPQEVKDKISKSHIGIIFTEEHHKNMKISAKNKIITKEHRDKINLIKHKNKRKIIDLNTGIIYENINDVSEKLNLHCSNIYSILSRKRNKKYKFEYIEK